MSRYTTELRYLIEGKFDLGLNEYPIWDESYRSTLNEKIFKHYYFREIGFETEALFKFKLNEKMEEIMPYFNKLYETTQMEYDPIKNYSISEVIKHGKTITEEGGNDFGSVSITNSSGTNKGKTVDKDSDTPRGSLSYASQNETDHWLTSVSDTSSDGEHSTQGQNNSGGSSRFNVTHTNTGEDTRTKNGSLGLGDPSKRLQSYRNAIINIDMLIINSLSDLFMGVW